MHSWFRKSVLAIVAVATLAVTGAVAPAAAQGWGGHDRGGWEHRRWDHGGGWGHRGWDRGPRHHGGWGWGGWDGPRRHWRSHCWFEDRPVRVHTPWGPRIRYEQRRICR